MCVLGGISDNFIITLSDFDTQRTQMAKIGRMSYSLGIQLEFNAQSIGECGIKLVVWLAGTFANCQMHFLIDLAVCCRDGKTDLHFFSAGNVDSFFAYYGFKWVKYWQCVQHITFCGRLLNFIDKIGMSLTNVAKIGWRRCSLRIQRYSNTELLGHCILQAAAWFGWRC